MGIRIAAQELTHSLNSLDDNIMNSVQTVFDYWATRAVSDMRTNANWVDRTGNARNGLSSEVSGSGTQVSLILFHSVVYGIWLEVRWSGRYAIIGPTLQSVGPRLMSMIQQVVLSNSRPA